MEPLVDPWAAHPGLAHQLRHGDAFGRLPAEISQRFAARALDARRPLVFGADADVAAVGSYGARFTGVAYPGETLKAAVWKEDGRLLASVIAPARENAVVLTGVELIPA